MLKVKGKQAMLLVCLEKFQERRQKEGKGVSKRDVNAYLKKQEKEAGQPLNNAFARALEGIKLD